MYPKQIKFLQRKGMKIIWPVLGKALSKGTKGSIIQTVSQIKPGVHAGSPEIYLRILVLKLLIGDSWLQMIEI